SVLIPRPETAGLVALITDRYGCRPDLQVLDIGTGSGCIAISLARALPFCRIDAIDISAAALDIAQRNAAALKAKVNFIQSDILAAEPPRARYDIIVSNPPYIGESEKSDMDSRVLDHEPHGALFVPDNDPLLFYRTIARYGIKALKPGGRLYFEINSLYAVQMRDMLAAEGYSDIDVLRDYRGNYRFATAVLPQ
ncbi:MAG: peptide chain release factor N(5)-glutamine methyltransferase, partial [Muribaculaceae bacterium]|nr:peptide chain release factor N(5)-glutamine methyltransferase [Muribaculaceae bacterium]